MVCLPSAVFAQQVKVGADASQRRLKTVEATYTYHAPENVTLEQAKRTALDRAKLQALADVFGTVVSQYNTTRVENSSSRSDIDFLSIGGSEVKGEWIETIGTPIYNIGYSDNMLVITCTVRGKAREITSSGIDLQAKVLCNGTDDRFESDRFRNGDDLYLSFQSTADGFLAVYLVDADNQAFCLLPYRHQTSGIYPVRANRRYVFFHEKSAPNDERQFVDEYTMTCERQSEHNQLYVIFSPNQFTKAVDGSPDNALPRQLPFEDFNRWLVKCRRHDTAMTVKMMPMAIEK